MSRLPWDGPGVTGKTDKPAYFPFVIDRWIAGTRHMTLEQKGFYLELLIWLYEKRGRYIKDADHAARITGVRPQKSRRIFGEISHKFSKFSHGFSHSLVASFHRNGMKVKGLDAAHLPTVPDPDPDLSLTSQKIPLSGESKKGGCGGKNAPAKKPALVVVENLPGLNLKAWTDYQQHRTAIRARKLKPVSIERLQRWLIDQGDEACQAAIVDQTIRNGWTGLFELKAAAKQAIPKHTPEFEAWLAGGDTIEGEYEKH